MPIRLEKDLLVMLNEGARITPHKKQELIRITLRQYLPAVIHAEALSKPVARVTNVRPWPKGALAKAYKKIERENWDEIEAAIKPLPPRADD